MPSSSSPYPPGFTHALKTFKLAAQEVPAYKDFLYKNEIDSEKITNPADFSLIPPITKENYLKLYPLKDLMWGGQINNGTIISMSSGSSGTPFSWLRGEKSFVHSKLFLDNIYRTVFKTHQKSTLCIVGFAMGTWIGGTYVLAGTTELSKEGHKIVCVSPGINRDEIIFILKTLSPQFEQTIFSGYPPFIKDVLDEAVRQELPLSSLNISFLFAGENISEAWRDYVLEKAGITDSASRSICMYGTADAGIMGYESLFSITLRRLANQNTDLYEALFPHSTHLPTLVQYHPEERYTEVLDDYFLFTINGDLPLIRYNIKDKGRLITKAEILDLSQKYLPIAEKIGEAYADLPYLALYGRSDVAATFYALNIYPENIKHGLEQKEFEEFLTGKFILATRYHEITQDQTLHLTLEVRHRKDMNAALKKQILNSVVEYLRKHNSEYNRLCQEIKGKACPHLHFKQEGSPEFTIRVKHKWTIATPTNPKAAS